MKHTAAELRAMEKRGGAKTDWKVAAKGPCPPATIADDKGKGYQSRIKAILRRYDEQHTKGL